MSKAKGAGRKGIQTADKVLSMITLLFILAIIAYGGYAIWDSNYVTESAEAKVYESYKPTEETESFEELKAINPDVIGWVTVYGTTIDYPMLQADNNWKYINTDAKGNYSLTGSIFLDYKNQKEFSDFNNILYGHNMTPRVMFGNVKDFKEEDYFKTHKYGDIFYQNKHHGLEIFAMLSVDAYDFSVYAPGIQGDAAQAYYLSHLVETAMYSRQTGVTFEDRIVLLSTCSNTSTNGREILVARITDQTYEDEFKETEEGKFLDRIDPQSMLLLWQNLPGWGKGLIFGTAVLLITVITYRLRRRKGTKKGEQKKKHGT